MGTELSLLMESRPAELKTRKDDWDQKLSYGQSLHD